MSRPVFLGFLIFIVLMVGLASLHGAILSLSIPLLLYLFYGLWRAPDEIKLEVRRTLSAERVAPQTPVTITVMVGNRGADLEELALEDRLPPALTVVDGSNRHLISLGKGEIYTFEYSVRGPRGGFPLEAIHVEAGDHLGLLRLKQEFRTFGQIFVFPNVARLKYIPIRPRRTRVYAGMIPARLAGAGVEFFGVRDYQPGDSPRRINWRISARHVGRIGTVRAASDGGTPAVSPRRAPGPPAWRLGAMQANGVRDGNPTYDPLYSNDYQQERVADVGIVLDGRERSNSFADGRSLFEHSVLAAATLADAFLAQGNRVGLLVYSQYLQWTLPGYGKLQRERILHALSHAAPGASQIFDQLQYLPARMFPAESQIVLVSPLLEDDYSTLIQLRARGYQVMIVSPDPVAFELNYLPPRPEVGLAARVVRIERELLLQRLRRAGVQVIEWDVTQPFDQTARGAFGRRAQMENRL